MRDEIAFRPYRVAIITLDRDAAGPVARVLPRLAHDFSGLSVDVFAAGEWSENPLALAQCRPDRGEPAVHRRAPERDPARRDRPP